MVAQVMAEAYQGDVAGYYREDDLQIPIILRSEEYLHRDIAQRTKPANLEPDCGAHDPAAAGCVWF